jgi:hypothetical protein
MTHSASIVTDSRLGFGTRKPGLAELYCEWYRLQRYHLAPIEGDVLELGSGAGFIREIIPYAQTSELIECKGVDLSLNALDVGDKFNAMLSNLLMVNVFHHICDSMAFLRSASIALRPRGRLIMIEPWLNVWSTICYRLVGHEPLDPQQLGWSFPSNDPLFDANQAQPWIVFKRDNDKFLKTFPEFKIITIDPLMPFAYTLSGGHSVSFGISAQAMKVCRSIERKFLDRRLGMFALIVIEKSE